MMRKMPTRGWVLKETFHLCGVEGFGGCFYGFKKAIWGNEGDVVKKPISIGIPCVPNFKGVLSSIMRAFTSPIIIPKANRGPSLISQPAPLLQMSLVLQRLDQVQEILLELL